MTIAEPVCTCGLDNDHGSTMSGSEIHRHAEFWLDREAYDTAFRWMVYLHCPARPGATRPRVNDTSQKEPPLKPWFLALGVPGNDPSDYVAGEFNGPLTGGVPAHHRGEPRPLP